MARRVLFLTHRPPYPPSSGDAVRNWNLMQQLAARGWQVSLFTLASGESLSEHQEALSRVCEHYISAPVSISRPERLGRLLRASILRQPFQLDYFWDESAARLLHDELNEREYDVLMMEILYMLRYVPEEWLYRSVLDTHNAEFLRLRSMAKAAGFSARGIAARLAIGPSRRLEAWAATHVAQVLAVSGEEQSYFETLAPGKVSLIPNGTVIGEEHSSQASSTDVLFVSSLDYSANAKGAEFLIESVLPKLRNPAARLTIIGRNPPARLVKLAASAPLPVEILGYVDDLAPYYRKARVVVAPILFGGGTRLKILESMAQGTPVVSTSVGCEGTGVIDGEHLLIADDPAGMAASIDRLLVDDVLCERLCLAGRNFVQERYDWRNIGGKLDDVLTGLLRDQPLSRAG